MKYEDLKEPVLRRLMNDGDVAAAREADRRANSQVAKSPGVLWTGDRPRPRLRGWERPLTSSRYSWWPPTQAGAPSLEMERAAQAFWSSRDAERKP